MKRMIFIGILVFAFTATFSQIRPAGPNADYQGPASREIALYSQMTPHPTYPAIASQEFPDFSDCRLQSADDFIVPAGPSWVISRIEVIGEYSGVSYPSFIIEIYADNGGLPAASPLYSQSGLSYTETIGLWSIPLSTEITLPPGHYWISVMVDASFATWGQWFWQWHDAPQINYEFANQDPCSLIGGGWTTSWGAGSTNWPPPGNTTWDLTFALYGNPAGEVPLSDWAIYFGIFLILAFTVIRIKKII